MNTIRKYAASGYDYRALTAKEQDALRDEAPIAAEMERSAAIRDLAARIGRALRAVPAMLTFTDQTPPAGRRPHAPLQR